MAAEQGKISTVKIQLITLVVALFSSYLFGEVANYFGHNDLMCSGLGDAAGCDPQNVFLYIFGFYFGLLFLVSFSNFLFFGWKRRYYYALIVPLLLVGLIEFEVLKFALVFTFSGVILGIMASKLGRVKVITK